MTNEQLFKKAQEAKLKPVIEDGKVIIKGGNFFKTFSFAGIVGAKITKILTKRGIYGDADEFKLMLEPSDVLKVSKIGQIAI